MTITRFEIDFLNVGAADACLIHFINDENNEHFIVLIDSGNYSDGDSIVDFMNKYYEHNYINLAICTHCDKDHFGGFMRLIELREEKKVGIAEFWINDPGQHVSVDEYKRYRNHDNLVREARSIYDLNDKNLIQMIDDAGITRNEAFSYGGKFYQKWDGLIDIIGPEKNYYEELVPNLRHSLEPYDESMDINEKCFSANCLSPTLDNAKDDDSTHNQSSVVIMFKPNDSTKVLFLGDGIANMLPSDWDKCKDVEIVKIPHHGSKHNLSSEIIQHLNPDYAIISTQKIGKYLSQAVVNALKKHGTGVYSTHTSGNLCYQYGFPSRTDYVNAHEL